MVELADLANASPGTVREIAERLGADEHDVRHAIQTARRLGHNVEIIGREGRFNIYRVRLKKPRRARFNVREAAEKRPVAPLWSLPLAPEATFKQAREVMAERVTRDCMRCKKKISTTRHGPRYCDDCRRYITSIS